MGFEEITITQARHTARCGVPLALTTCALAFFLFLCRNARLLPGTHTHTHMAKQAERILCKVYLTIPKTCNQTMLPELHTVLVKYHYC